MGFKKQFLKLFCGCTGRSKKNQVNEFESYEPSIKPDLKREDFDLNDFEEEIVTKAVKEEDLGILISDDIKCVSLNVMEELHRLLIEKKRELNEKIADFDSKLLSSTAVAVPSTIGIEQQASVKFTFKLPKFSAFEFTPEMVTSIFSGQMFQNKLINFDCFNLDIASQPKSLLALPCPPAALAIESLLPAAIPTIVVQASPMLAICAPPQRAPPSLAIELPFALPAIGKAPGMLSLRASPTSSVIELQSLAPPVVGKAPQMPALCSPALKLPSPPLVVIQASQSVAPIAAPSCSQKLAIELPPIVKGQAISEPIDVGFFEFDLTSPLSRHCLKLPEDAASAVELLNKILEDEGFEDSKYAKDDAIVNLK